jgi:hypothetical protein
MGVAVVAFSIMSLAFVRGGIEDIVRVKGFEIEGEVGKEGDHSWGKIKRLLTNPLILALMSWSFFYVSP